MKTWYPEADLVVLHPKIYTVALTVEQIQAGRRDFPIIDDGGVAIKDGKIIAVGTAAEVEPHVGAATQVIDATGGICLPGFIESHMHCTWTGNNLRNIDFRAVRKREDAKRLIREYAEKTPSGEWIQGNSWIELVWDDKTVITRRELDELAPNNPLFCMRSDFHTAMVNSAALEAAGITKEMSDPKGGSIGHYDDGELNGLLYENSAMELVLKVIPALSFEQSLESLEAVGKHLNNLGITSAIDANLGFDEMRYYLEAHKRGQLSYRANLMFYLDSAYGDVTVHLRRLDEMDCITGFGNEMIKLNGVKVTLDGIPATYTALMREGYKTKPEYKGSSVWIQEEITALVVKAQELGWQFGIHTIGDAAADMALNAFEAAAQVSPVEERRHYLIHYMFPQEDQWPRMKALGVGVTVQPTIVSTMGEAPLFYEAQAKRIQSPGLMFAQGIVCGGSSDSPVVPACPVMGMYYAITRLDETSGEILSEGDESKVSPLEALIMWTKYGAFFLHDDDKLGSVEVGNLGDLVLFDHDFIAGDIEGYRTAKVAKTILAGKIVYEA